MNDNQYKFLICAAVLLVGMVLYPPFIIIGANGVTLNMGYSWLLDPPTYGTTPTYIATVNTALLITQELVAAAVSGAIYVILNRKRSV